MKQLTARDMAQIAIVAAIYIVLTITPPLNAMAYYGYQFRVSEMLTYLVLDGSMSLSVEVQPLSS